MTPAEQYQAFLDRGEIKQDPRQQGALHALERLYRELSVPRRKMNLVNRVLKKKITPVKGLYLWGGVGRGKTFLIDLCYESLPFEDKQRVHFGQFMREIHRRLQNMPKQPNPLIVLAEEISLKIRVLFLDEFHVDDITDAMILAEFLQGLFDRGVSLVTTSNIEPDKLYLNGLQRTRFLPAIALIKANTEVLELDGKSDYRLQLLEHDGTYHTRVNGSEYSLLSSQFHALCGGNVAEPIKLDINFQTIAAIAEKDGVAWFSFDELCNKPRSASDYIEIAKAYHTILVSGIPQLNEAHDDQAQRFIQLIDSIYDHNVNLVASANSPPDQIYHGKRLAFPFERTVSRLFEMRSHEYLAKAHKTH
ncbi:MAG: cell division protein ZapE [Gammaproteobacteria bacterium]|nr:cell division protein ZapE [Gammaproteobacteria bacterium]